MIQTQTIVDVVDNSGAKSLRCIKVFGGFKKRYGVLGSVIRASIQELRHKSNKKSVSYTHLTLPTKRIV